MSDSSAQSASASPRRAAANRARRRELRAAAGRRAMAASSSRASPTHIGVRFDGPCVVAAVGRFVELPLGPLLDAPWLGSAVLDGPLMLPVPAYWCCAHGRSAALPPTSPSAGVGSNGIQPVPGKYASTHECASKV